MKERQAVTALAALAHEQRLRIFRTLVKQGLNGMAAGDIAGGRAKYSVIAGRLRASSTLWQQVVRMAA